MKDKIEFKSIKQKGGGQVCLTIYPPGKFIRNKGYAVFVGGSGQGERPTLEGAKELLLQRAIAYCERRMDQASEIINEYAKHKTRLLKKGIENLKQL